MNSCQFSISLSALANLLADALRPDELTLLAASLVQLGDTLATISSWKAFLETVKN